MSKNKPKSHAKKRKILWGRVFASIFLIIVLLLIVILSITVFLKNDDKKPENNNPTASDNSSAVESASSSNSVNSITASVDYIYLIPDKTKNVTVQYKADNAADIEAAEWKSSNESVATVDNSGNITGVAPGTCTVTVSCEHASDEINVTVRNIELKDGITYIDGIMIVNKIYGLPESYNPGDTLPETKDAFERMAEDAAKENLNLYIGSGFRTYEYQVEIFGNYSSIYGEEEANRFSSKPGHSEHQTGYTIDCNTIDSAFGDTLESDWLAQHCADYGFIVRYPDGKENITGYEYEPWHIRYVGVDVAKDIYSKGLTLEEYLGIDGDTIPAITPPETVEETSSSSDSEE